MTSIEHGDVITLTAIKWQFRTIRNLCIYSAARRMLCLICWVSLSACATVPSKRTALAPDAVPVDFVAREWTGHTDGRVYGGVAMPTGTLSGILGSYRGCLVEIRSRTLILLTGAMEFHPPDDHSVKQHIFSKSPLGDRPAFIIPVGGSFTVQGSKIRTLPDWERLDQKIPAQCARLRLFFTTTETLKPK
jgi:hypothetical protein